MKHVGKWLPLVLVALVLGVSNAQAMLVRPGSFCGSDFARDLPLEAQQQAMPVAESCAVVGQPQPGDMLLARDVYGRIWIVMVESVETHNGEIRYVLSPMGLCAETRILGFISWPDYWVFNINVAIPNPLTLTLVGWSGALTVDRHMDVSWSILGGGVGKSATMVSGSVQAGWLNQTTIPSQKQTTSFITGNGVNFTAGYIGGGGETWSPGNGFATQIGIVSPQIGVSYNYSFLGRTGAK